MYMQSLPTRFDPMLYVRRAYEGEGRLSLKTMARLQNRLLDQEGEITYQVAFGVDAQSIKFVRGQVTGICHLQCQRCLESVDYNLYQEFQLGLVRSEQEADQLPQQYEPLILDEDCETISMTDLVEEEILLALPIVHVHEEGQCSVKVPVAAQAPVVDQEQQQKPRVNPFAVLKELKDLKQK